MKTKNVRANNHSPHSPHSPQSPQPPQRGGGLTTPSKTLYDKIKETLAVASQLVIASPLKLPPKVVAAAKYLALALGVLEAVESAAKKGDEDES